MLKTWLIKNRPLALFDAANAEHRRAYNTYKMTGSWSDCKYQFVVEDPYYDLPTMIDNKLVKFYLEHEFHKL